jgi:hypothetical protein
MSRNPIQTLSCGGFVHAAYHRLAADGGPGAIMSRCGLKAERQ